MNSNRRVKYLLTYFILFHNPFSVSLCLCV